LNLLLDYSIINQTNTLMPVVFVGLGVMLVAGLIAIPALEEAHAKNGRVTNNGKHLDQIKNGGGPPRQVRAGCG
jgi:hypothetical protein